MLIPVISKRNLITLLKHYLSPHDPQIKPTPLNVVTSLYEMALPDFITVVHLSNFLTES